MLDAAGQPHPDEVKDGDVKPWTIKGIPPEVRNAVIAAAGREGLTIGEWLSRHIPLAIAAVRNQNRLPAVVSSQAPSPAPRAPVDLVQDVTVLRELVQVAREVNPEGLPVSIARSINGRLRAQLKELRRRAEG